MDTKDKITSSTGKEKLIESVNDSKVQVDKKVNDENVSKEIEDSNSSFDTDTIPEENSLSKIQKSKRRQKKKGKPGWLIKVVEIVFTAVITCVLTVVATLYIQSKSKPKLSIDYSWCMGTTVKIEKDETQFITFLTDIKSQSIISGSIVGIKFEPIDGYNFTPNVNSYIGKIIVANEGEATATDVRIGIGYLYPTEFSIVVSPNVRAMLTPSSSPTKSPSIVASPYYREIQIDFIPPGEKAFVTLSWTLDPKVKDINGEPVEPNMYYVPEITYLSSKETLGNIRSFITYNQATELEGNSLSSSHQPFWRASLSTKKGAKFYVKEITSSDNFQIDLKFNSPPPVNPSAPIDRR